MAVRGEAAQGAGKSVLRLVLDTNVWLDWLVFDDPRTAPVRTALREGRAELFIDARCEDELVRALGYPLRKTALGGAAQAACLVECRRFARRIAAGARPDEAAGPALPACRDSDDQKFLELALECRADFLITRDLALLELARRIERFASFRIVDPAQFGAALTAC